jgi:asparagine synthase (glutamine-hydrolysing)
MCQALYHRGPDDEGMDIAGGVALGMRRLAIIDVAGGQQPMFNEDRTVRVVFNGEIYNYRELRDELQAKGHQFLTHSDTEVIAHLWEEEGLGFADRLNGMFAVALHDLRQRKLVLARDHLGIKPLFYAHDDRALVFGSEVKAVLASGLVERRLDVDALGQFVAWEYVPAPATLLRDIRKLEPATVLEVDLASGQRTLHRFWDVPLGGHSPARTPSEWEEVVDAKIHECVRRQLVSDVPLGAFLSGGVDSSLVVAHMVGAKTFSIGFHDPTYDELPWAQAVAKHLDVEHYSEVIEPDAAGLFETVMHGMDDPIGDFSIFPTFLVSQYARRSVTVALSGDGGDELFGGYETYLAQQQARRWSRTPALLRKLLIEPVIRSAAPTAKKKGFVNKAKRFVEGLAHGEQLGHTRWRIFVGEALRMQLFTPEAQRWMSTPVGAHIETLARRAHRLDEVDRGLYVDVRSYLVDNCLVKLDRMSMATSLESRVPLLDKELVELAFQVPSSLKVGGGRTKVLLKKIASRHVPSRCVYRPKEGFSIPMKAWLTTAFRPRLEELLAPARLAQEGIFDVRCVERLKAEHLANRANHSHVLWALMVFEDWRRRWAV